MSEKIITLSPIGKTVGSDVDEVMLRQAKNLRELANQIEAGYCVGIGFAAVYSSKEEGQTIRTCHYSQYNRFALAAAIMQLHYRIRRQLYLRFTRK